MRFRKKPVVIEAMQLDGTIERAHEIDDWMGEGVGALINTGDNYGGMLIPTLEGAMTANAGDWIIKGIKGEFYPCKSDIFEATYEQVE